VPWNEWKNAMKRKANFVLAVLILIGTLSGVSNCSKTVLYDKNKGKEVVAPVPSPSPGEKSPETVKGAGDGNPALNKKIKLTIKQIKPDAWWRVCISAEVIGHPSTKKVIGCNKDANQIDKEVEIKALENACNVLKISATVQMNKGTTCTPGNPCNGPYEPTADWIRTTSEESGLPFFKVFDGTKLLPLDKMIKLDKELEGKLDATQKEAVEFVKGGVNRWLRVYFEDQSNENFSNFKKIAAPTDADSEKFGVDFNDYIVDLRGENVQFGVEGVLPSCK
jgi:hypothetical protein